MSKKSGKEALGLISTVQWKKNQRKLLEKLKENFDIKYGYQRNGKINRTGGLLQHRVIWTKI
jgi:hypothetical protein